MPTGMTPASRARARLAKLLGRLVLVGITLVLFDLAAYFLVPGSYTTFAPSYRDTRLLLPADPGQPVLTRAYHRYYFRADDSLGFDINPGARGTAEVDGHPYEIFANSLGCTEMICRLYHRRAPPRTGTNCDGMNGMSRTTSDTSMTIINGYDHCEMNR